MNISVITKNWILLRAFQILFLTALSLSVLYLLNNAYNLENREISGLRDMDNQINQLATELSGSVRQIEGIVDKISRDINDAKVSINDIDGRLRNDLGFNTWMHGLGIAMEPNQIPGVDELFSRNYIVGTNRKIKHAAINYNYTEFEYEWYRKPLLNNRNWSEPYYSLADQELVVEYGAAFWLPGRTQGVDAPSGVVFGNLSIENIKNLVQLDNRLISYYYLISQQGRFIVHPDLSRVLSGETIFEYAWEKKDPQLHSMAIHSIGGESGHIDHQDPVTSTRSWLIHRHVDGLDWTLVAVVEKDRLVDQNKTRTHWFNLFALVIVLAVLLIAVLLISRNLAMDRLLTVSIGFSFCVFVGVAALWKISDIYPKHESEVGLSVMSTNILNEYRNRQTDNAARQHQPAPKFVGTGVYLQSLEFDGANNVKVSAYIWQHYLKGEHKGLKRGFVLPEADSPTIEEVYRISQEPTDSGCFIVDESQRDCEEVVGWYVSATLRQEFDYSHYPLDSQQVWLKIWHEAIQENVILIPQLDSYAFPNPKLAPGVQHDFVLPGWTVEESWFSLNEQVFSTNFGNSKISGLQSRPELLFNVSIQRQFMNPFVSRVIPLVLVAILMFLIVLISTKSSNVSEWLGFSANDVVVGLSALFFVVGINHSDMRQLLQSSNIMYFEYFYFVIYAMLLYVAISSIYIAKHEVVKGRDENFVTKVLYWPVLSVVLFSVTYAVFR